MLNIFYSLKLKWFQMQALMIGICANIWLWYKNIAKCATAYILLFYSAFYTGCDNIGMGGFLKLLSNGNLEISAHVDEPALIFLWLTDVFRERMQAILVYLLYFSHFPKVRKFWKLYLNLNMELSILAFLCGWGKGNNNCLKILII